ncbi:hypothetical protein BD770DRAFT_441452 [Pilaira anomala]|nr:hypothetical protein BD770DRAFT_441452 [Pilaira anomala]
MDTEKCLPFPIKTIPLMDDIMLPPTPNPSDDEDDIKPTRLARRDTVSLSDLIPLASEALREKRRISLLKEQQYNPPSDQDGPLCRAITKVKYGIKSQRIRERGLRNEWLTLALQLPVDYTTINSRFHIANISRTKEIRDYLGYKQNRASLSITELEERVIVLREQRLVFREQQAALPPTPSSETFLDFFRQ